MTSHRPASNTHRVSDHAIVATLAAIVLTYVASFFFAYELAESLTFAEPVPTLVI
jgi:hypothetical protein